MAARLSWLAYDLRDEIAELDLNPVIVLPKNQGAFAVDALVVCAESLPPWRKIASRHA
jgi:hypothetical protein